MELLSPTGQFINSLNEISLSSHGKALDACAEVMVLLHLDEGEAHRARVVYGDCSHSQLVAKIARRAQIEGCDNASALTNLSWLLATPAERALAET